MERVVVGVVGVLQFEVLEYRMKSEYGVDYIKRDLPHEEIKRIKTSGDNPPDRLTLTSDTMWVKDFRDRDLLIFPGSWAINWAYDKNPGLELSGFDAD